MASGAVLARAGARALVRADRYERLVEVTVTGPADARQELAGLCQAELRSIHALIPGLNPHEETEVVTPDSAGRLLRGWVSVSSLKMSEETKVPGALSVENAATVTFDPTPKLNEFTKPAARDDSWKPRVFISYAHTDDRSRKSLETELKVLRTRGAVHELWTDRCIQPGEDWDRTIKTELESADVIVLLVSKAALASDYIQAVEMKRAMERHAAGETVLVAVMLDCRPLENTPLAQWQAILPHGKPVLDNKPQRHGWDAVAKELHEVFARLRAKHGAK